MKSRTLGALGAPDGILLALLTHFPGNAVKGMSHAEVLFIPF
jgi:hypothetical protein